MSTKIEWCEESWNPVTGCTKISEGCKNCYAERMAKRLAGRFGYPKDDPFKISINTGKLNQPLHWKKPKMIFVCSMGDLFHTDVPKWFLDRIFDRIFYDGISHHKFLILTKRPQNMYDYFKELNLDIPENVWLGVSVENQKTADERIPILLQIPAKIRFVSIEPMLESINLKIEQTYETAGTMANRFFKQIPKGLDWIIVGGESGHNARPMHPDWVRKIRDNCIQTGTPFFFKQWGKWMPAKEEFPGLCRGQNQETYSLIGSLRNIKRIDKETLILPVGKKEAGRLLDGREWNQYPRKDLR